jgi:SlyX protein
MVSDLPENSRLDELEARIAHQDRVIADLNDAITSQWSKIDALERQIARLIEEYQNIGASPDGPDSPPPHY